jgi:hypothetical protein
MAPAAPFQRRGLLFSHATQPPQHQRVGLLPLLRAELLGVAWPPELPESWQDDRHRWGITG